MEITGPDESEEFQEIISEGMMEVFSGKWVPIEVSVIPDRETEKAYHGTIAVYEVDSSGRCDDLCPETKGWVPKSMSDNPWWICTNTFSHQGKVSNRRFDGY